MELKDKSDLDVVLRRFEAWWECRILDRPPVTVPCKETRSPGPAAKKHPTLRQRWMDFDYTLDRFEAQVSKRKYLADTVPIFLPNLGPEVVATLFGCELEFGERTSWSKPVARSCREILALRPDFETEYWTTIRQATDESLRRGRGKWITALTDLHTNGDLLAALRDPQELCLDVADDLPSVRAACDHVTDFFPQIYGDLYDRIAAAGQPAATWVPSFHAGKMYATSCDFICMISPEQFRRTILPSLVREMRYLDRNIFHLDGPGALRHLDDLLALPELDGVQWICGAGQEPAARWIDVYRRIQAAGKCMEVLCDTFGEARKVTEHLRPEGVWLSVRAAYTAEEIAAFLREVERWAAGKR